MDPEVTSAVAQRSVRRARADRERLVLDVAAELFYARGVHEVGMDELVRRTGLGKATVYRLFPTKDALVAAYLGRLAAVILGEIDAQIAAPGGAGAALRAVLDAVAADLSRAGFRGCAFNNASIEYDDPAHPARVQAREYRLALRARIGGLTDRLLPADPVSAAVLAGRLAVLIDGAYTSAAHLGPDGPAADGLVLAAELVACAERGPAVGRRPSRRGPR
jgi:AcrR family transcriptional regulator